MKNNPPVKIFCFEQTGKSPRDERPDNLRKVGVEWCPVVTAQDQWLQVLIDALDKENDQTVVLVISDPERVSLSGEVAILADRFALLSTDVVFAASSTYLLEDQRLHYFYWKHYPRPHERYNYLDSTAFVGTAGGLKALLRQAMERYGEQCSYHDALSRYYADSACGCFQSEVKFILDHDQVLMASTRLSAKPQAQKGWMYEMLYARNERDIYSQNHLISALTRSLNISREGGTFRHLTGTNPLVVVQDTPSPATPGKASFLLNMRAHLQTVRQLFLIGKANKWHFQKERIFRHLPNKSAVIHKATELLVGRLEAKKPVSFAHYNDGELTFIQDFLKGEQHEKWFGRKQQQYNPVLAERLYEAMRFQKEGYLVGVPCSLDHPKLRKQADEIVGDYEYKVQAMAIHHNLAFMPRLLEALKGRKVYFFTNEYQDLSFFEAFGIEMVSERIFQVPFRNSYLEYDRFKDMRFPDEAVVVLTCGMLAKILTKVWYENHDSLSVLALGSSLDDHIQKKNISFELYPSDLPLTRNLHRSRSFLFGYKPTCKECFDFDD